MLAHEMKDELDPLDVSTADRSELIAYIQKLERQRSAWELRIRASEERDELYRRFVTDMTEVLGGTFIKINNFMARQSEKTAKLIERMREIARHVEDL